LTGSQNAGYGAPLHPVGNEVSLLWEWLPATFIAERFRSHRKKGSTSLEVIRFDDFVKRPRSRRANLVARGVLKVRRSDSEMKRNAEIGLFTKSSRLRG